MCERECVSLRVSAYTPLPLPTTYTQLIGSHQRTYCPRLDALQVYAQPMAHVLAHTPGGHAAHHAPTNTTNPVRAALHTLVPVGGLVSGVGVSGWGRHGVDDGACTTQHARSYHLPVQSTTQRAVPPIHPAFADMLLVYALASMLVGGSSSGGVGGCAAEHTSQDDTVTLVDDNDSILMDDNDASMELAMRVLGVLPGARQMMTSVCPGALVTAAALALRLTQPQQQQQEQQQQQQQQKQQQEEEEKQGLVGGGGDGQGGGQQEQAGIGGSMAIAAAAGTAAAGISPGEGSPITTMAPLLSSPSHITPPLSVTNNVAPHIKHVVLWHAACCALVDVGGAAHCAVGKNDNDNHNHKDNDEEGDTYDNEDKGDVIVNPAMSVKEGTWMDWAWMHAWLQVCVFVCVH